MKERLVSQQEILNNSGIPNAPGTLTHLERAEVIAKGILCYTMQEQNEMVKAIYQAVEGARRVKIRELTDEIEALNQSIETL